MEEEGASVGDARGKHRILAELGRVEQEVKFLEVRFFYIILKKIEKELWYVCRLFYKPQKPVLVGLIVFEIRARSLSHLHFQSHLFSYPMELNLGPDTVHVRLFSGIIPSHILVIIHSHMICFFNFLIDMICFSI